MGSGFLTTGSTVVVHELSCPLVRMWDLPGPGIKPMSPALAGRFLTTGPPGKFRRGGGKNNHF